MPTFTCEICHSLFQVCPAHAARNANRFCSKKCQGRGQLREAHPAWKGAKPHCLTCGSEITTAWGQRRQTARFCSRACQQWLTKQAGPRPTGRTQTTHRRTSPQVRQRDRQCVLCGSLGTVVHHINGDWQDQRSENRCLLCRPCHSKLHNADLTALRLLLSWLVDQWSSAAQSTILR